MKKIFIFALPFILISCSKNQKSEQISIQPVEQTINNQIEALLDADRYMDALELLTNLENTEEINSLREIIHLNYGLFLEYRDSNVSNMRDKMNGALRQYIEVLKINPDNEKAITEIEQILEIYSTFPDRSPDPDIMDELEKLGL